MLRSRKAKREFGAIPEISMTPLIDVALTLLVIFIVASPMIENGLKINVPHGQLNETKGDPRNFIVSINKDGKSYLNDIPMSVADIIKKLKKNHINDIVFVRMDKTVDYGTFVSLLDKLKSSGIKHVNLDTKKAIS